MILSWGRSVAAQLHRYTDSNDSVYLEKEIMSNQSPLVPSITIEGERKALLTEVTKLKKEKVSKLRTVNQGWNIGLTVSSLTLTAITTILGVIKVEEEHKNWITFFVVTVHTPPLKRN
ncbi:hypothetical protein [Dolichospermum sp. UHCC 0259]|uniref:hypothetical protein n=1 Tax=Dolichospermum sp. UHCC 0259 TaxID=2590010 RepID=UPI0014467EAB|nr:hypothetical protein [Dolichospermum sp. UHCC 0259]MTJ48219.1 hypothetical protein [Dolichospermum sp. UHCC 0259]